MATLTGARPRARKVKGRETRTNKPFSSLPTNNDFGGKDCTAEFEKPLLANAASRLWPSHYNVGCQTGLPSSITMDFDSNAVVHCNGSYKDGCYQTTRGGFCLSRSGSRLTRQGRGGGILRYDVYGQRNAGLLVFPTFALLVTWIND